MPINADAWNAAQAAAADPKVENYPSPGNARLNARSNVLGVGRRGGQAAAADDRRASRQRADSDPEGR